MKYKELEHDLFEVNEVFVKPNEELYCLAQCISADFAMAGGIVLEFNKRWNMKERLVEFYGNAINKFKRNGGMCIPMMVKNSKEEQFPVFNLITKRSVRQQPTYDDIKKALEDMMFEMDFKGYHKLAMPLIGCGIDGKDWAEVSKIIQEVFKDTNVEILICRRKEK